MTKPEIDLNLGISGLSVYFPEPKLRLAQLAEERNAELTDGDRRDFVKSLKFTAQKAMRVPEVWEDTVTMVAESVRELLDKTGVEPAQVTQFLCGTETATDNAKPIASFAQGALLADGIQVGPEAAVYELKHACAGGTYALLAAMNQVALDAARGLGGPAIVSMGDVSRYDLASTAELTQGAGAVSMVVEPDPKLIRFDLGVVDYHSTSVDDFFRAIGSVTAKAKGKYSVQCYKEALLGAYQSFKERALSSGLIEVAEGEHFLDSFDYVILHAPFKAMPLVALRELLAQARGISDEEAQTEMERLRLDEALEGNAQTGNLYTGSLYVCLATLRTSELERIGKEVEGKRILFASYGSGNTMIVFSGEVVPGATEAIEKIEVRSKLASAKPVDVKGYEHRMVHDKFDRDAHAALLAEAWDSIPEGRYYLREIREDGYRIYAVKGKDERPGSHESQSVA